MVALEQFNIHRQWSGIVITTKGNGEAVSTEKTVMTHYAVYFEDGRLLDTSLADVARAYNMYNPNRPYQPIPARVDADAQMITGFKEGLRLLSVGDKATLYLPYELAYGANGGRIPPQTNLIFEVEVLDWIEFGGCVGIDSLQFQSFHNGCFCCGLDARLVLLINFIQKEFLHGCLN